MTSPEVHNQETVPHRRAQLQELMQQEHCTRVDRMFVVLMLVQFAGAVVTAFVVSPKTWIGDTAHVHIHIWAAIILGALISGGPILAVCLRPGSQQSRLMMALSQGLWSALFIHISGGRLETHFHVFGSLAFVAFYKDWKVLLVTTVVVALDHCVRGIWWPLSVYGITTISPYRWLEHAAWVVFEDIFLVFSIVKSQKDVASVCRRQAELEAVNSSVEEMVRVRTQELQTARSEAERLALVAKYTDNAALVLDSAGRVEWVNDAFTRITGYAADEVKGRIPIEVLRGPNTRDEDVQAILDGIREQKPVDVEVLKTRKDGTDIAIEIELRPICDSAGEVTGMIQIDRDVTAVRDAERERARLSEHLQAAAREAGRAEIAAGVLHNVGNALNSINVAAGVLRQSLSNSSVDHLRKSSLVIDQHRSELAEFLTSNPQGQHFPTLFSELTTRLVNQRIQEIDEVETLLENIECTKRIVASHESVAGQKERRQQIDLVSLANAAIAMQQDTFVRDCIKVRTTFADTPPVSGMRERMIDALTVLLTNAREAMEGINVIDRILTVNVVNDEEFVRVEVIDRGVGISSLNLANVFKPGFTSKTSGHGFGLHTSAIMASELGGSLTAHSDGEGLGATFTLRLPAIQSPVPETT